MHSIPFCAENARRQSLLAHKMDHAYAFQLQRPGAQGGESRVQAGAGQAGGNIKKDHRCSGSCGRVGSDLT